MNARIVAQKLGSSPYHLGAGPEDIHTVLAEVADELLVEVERRYGTLVDTHERQVPSGEFPRTRGEYAVELLTFGVLLSEYGHLVTATPVQRVAEMEELWHLRSTAPQEKARADRRRGELFAELLWATTEGASPAPSAPPSWSDLTRWLAATGEFVQEARRLVTWLPLFEGLEPGSFMAGLEALANWFRLRAQSRLGHFTAGVEAYRAKILGARVPREDLLLITRREVLYHLNLVGAQVMNRGFEQGYAARPRKVVLLPGCMRVSEQHCQAHRDGLDIRCNHCSSRCQISAITDLGEKHGFEVYIVPHASSFSAWLEHWRGNDSAALVAAACPLHLVPGGYEMRALGLEAQCVLLEYSGCRRHWDPLGTPTQVDPKRLLRVVQASSLSPGRRAHDDGGAPEPIR